MPGTTPRLCAQLSISLWLFTSGGGTAWAASGTLADPSGEVAAWGNNFDGQTTVPAGAFTAIAAGDFYSVGLRSDGTLAGWGLNHVGQINVPTGTFSALAAGNTHGLGIRSEGTLAGWGLNSNGQTTVPSGTFSAIAGGDSHSLGIRSDGTLAGWGSNAGGQTDVPSGIFSAIAGGDFHSLGLRARTAYDGDLLVSYSGSAAGPNGLKANLNRNITVAGNATIQSPMHLYNNPNMTVAGHVLLESAGQINGAANIDGRIIGEAGSSIVATGPLTLGRFNHLQGFSTAGDLDAGAHVVTLRSLGFASLGGMTSLGGGTLAAASGVHFAPGGAFQGRGSINARVAVSAGATLEATGNLTLGNNTALDGFFSNGSLNVNGHTVTIRDSNRGVLGSLTSIGSTHPEPVGGGFFTPAADYGTLTAANGLLLPEGNNLSGWGTVGGAFKDQGHVQALQPPALLNLRPQQLTFTGAVTGRGSFAGDVLFEGSYSPGDSPAQVEFGSMTLGADATLVIELGGLEPGSQHDKLLADAAHLAGALEVDLINGFTPQLGDTFDVISATAGVTGAFAQLVQPLGMPAGLHFDVIYSPTLVQLEVARNFTADFDVDGDVDAEDLAQWQGDFGANDFSDADDDGDSDGADFLAWQQQLGAPAPPTPAAAVPEPGACPLAAAASLFLAMGRRGQLGAFI